MTGGPYCYTYDGDGLRVRKAHGTCTGSPTVDVLYWRSTSGETIAETGGGGSTTNSAYHEYILFAGRRVARSDVSAGNVFYYFADHLGSTRVMTQANGTVCFKMEYYPYGQEQPNSKTNCSTGYEFTGYERDSETSLDYAFARYYSARLARFTSGDPIAGNAVNPQSLNRYTYTLNNTLNLIDPSGLSCENPQDDKPCVVQVVDTMPDWVEVISINDLQAFLRTGRRPAANNTRLPTKAQVKQCLDQSYKDAPGKTVELLSPLQMVPGFGQNPLFSVGETAVGTTSKAVVVTNIAENAGKPAITTIFSDGWSLAGLAERGLGALARGLINIAPYAWGGAAIADLNIHAVCQTGDPNVLMGIMP